MSISIIESIKKGDTAGVERLLKSGADINQTDEVKNITANIHI